MKNHLILLFILLRLGSPALSQKTRHLTTTGLTSFFSETPVENINADNGKSQVILNASNGDIAVRIPIRDFVFQNKLMQEHFNENYMESDRFPTATFTGKISTNPDYQKDGTYHVSAKGALTIHGVAKDRELTGTLTVKDGAIRIISDFEVALADHQIEVPKLVFVKIAQVIQVKTDFTLK